MAYEIEGFDFDKHIDSIIELAKSVEKGKVTILTGPNGYGKSFIRKVIGMRNSKYDFPKAASISMEMRCNAKEDYSALKSIMMEKGDDASSNHTYYMVSSLFKSATDRYLIIDEPEIGMGAEMLLGLIEFMRGEIDKQKAEGKFLGLMFITHSTFFIDNMPHDEFLNLEGMTYDQWKNRPIKAINPDKLAAWCSDMWRAIEKRLK